MEDFVAEQTARLLKPVSESWQPSDFLPDSASPDFPEKLAGFREQARVLPDDVLVVLVGDMITEEALPSYQTWFNRLHGVEDPNGVSDRPWSVWSRGWTAEENRHGDLLNRYLYLSGRVNMRAVETTIQYLIREGFDPQTARDPYLGFVYTSFQERATKISHRNVATLAKKAGEETLHTICGLIAGDEARHETAYKAFMGKIFEIDPCGALESFMSMMKRKIVMPAVGIHDGSDRQLFEKFSKVAQRLRVYTVKDYAEIIRDLVRHWRVDVLNGLSGVAAQAQDYLCGLADRYEKLSERLTFGGRESFSWIDGREVG
jgi:acyl-[acyl-carrier-protein] desaturase